MSQRDLDNNNALQDRIGLQTHDDKLKVLFRNIMIKEANP